MKTLLPAFALAAGFLLAGCPKNPDTTVSGTDEEKLDQYAARLEELRIRMQAEAPPCDEVCSMAREVCEIAGQVCDIATRLERAQQRCVTANEDCARFNDSCASCSNR